VDRRYLKEFILNPEKPLESKVQKQTFEVPQQENQVNQALIQYQE